MVHVTGRWEVDYACLLVQTFVHVLPVTPDLPGIWDITFLMAMEIENKPLFVLEETHFLKSQILRKKSIGTDNT